MEQEQQHALFVCFKYSTIVPGMVGLKGGSPRRGHFPLFLNETAPRPVAEQEQQQQQQ